MGIHLTINGRGIEAAEGQTILQAARDHNIYIPTLCDFPGLPSHGHCRMCIVEVWGRSNTPTACTTLVEEGMEVATDTENLRGLRGDLLRMLLAEHPSACLFCPENQNCEECMITLHKAGVTTGCRTCPADGQCTLQEMVERSGLQSTAYPARYRALPVEDRDPFFDRDYNLCVLCGRCVRACETLHFSNIPTFVQRGSETRVGTNFGLSHLEAGCSFCGACVDACPTGALWEKSRKWDGIPDGAVESVCPFCSLGCEIQLLHKDGMVIGALPGENVPMLCVLGRYGIPEMVNHPSRVKDIMRIEAGQAVKIDWQEACRLAAEELSGCAPDDFALVVSADCASEDLAAAVRFIDEVMGAGAVYLSGASRYGEGLADAKRLLEGSCSLEELDRSDLIFCLGLDLHYHQSVAEPYLLRARARGAKIITLNANEHVPGRFADVWLRPDPSGEEALLSAIAAGQDGQGITTEARRLLRDARRPALLVGPDFLEHRPEVVSRLQKSTGAAVVALPAAGNLAGLLRYSHTGKPVEKQPRLLYLIGSSIPVGLDAQIFVIYQNSYAPDDGIKTAIHSGLMLPMAAFSETSGSVLTPGGKTRRFSAAVPPTGEALPAREIIRLIAQAMGKTDFETVDENDLSQGTSSPAFNKPPSWLPCLNGYEYMGAPLAGWVEGLRQLNINPREENPRVPSA